MTIEANFNHHRGLKDPDSYDNHIFCDPIILKKILDNSKTQNAGSPI